MELKRLQKVMDGVARLFESSGATAQARSARKVAEVLRDAPDSTTEEFAHETKVALKRSAAVARLADESPEDMARQLRGLDQDDISFEQIISALKLKSCPAEKAVKVAGHYTGAGPTAYKTKSSAIKAIEAKHRERAFQASKARLNDGVTPF